MKRYYLMLLLSILWVNMSAQERIVKEIVTIDGRQVEMTHISEIDKTPSTSRKINTIGNTSPNKTTIVINYGDLVASGYCGASETNIKWKLYSLGTLFLEGEGKMANYSGTDLAPWLDYYADNEIKIIKVGEGITSIGTHAFSGAYKRNASESTTYHHINTSIKKISLPSTLTTICDCAFLNCDSLTSITIPAAVSSILGTLALERTGLTEIQVDANNKYFDSRNDCNAIIETSSNTLMYGCMNTVIPSTVTAIEWNAFSGCTGLTSFVIPKSVTSIGGYAFNECKNLTTLTCYADEVPKTGSNVFKLVPQSSAILYVPAASVDLYKSADQWKEFSQILPIGSTPGDDTPATDQIKIPATMMTNGTAISVIKVVNGGTESVIVP